MSCNPVLTNRLPVLLTIALLGSAAAAVADDDAALEEVRASISGKFDTIAPEDVKRSPVEGWYEIQKGSIVAYVSQDGRYLLQGDLIDLDAQVNLSEKSRNGARHDLLAALSDEDTILFSPVDPKFTVTVFTDVDCTYCRKLHSQIDEYMANGIGVRYVLYPRSGPASRTWNTSQQVWCAEDRSAALTAAKLGQAVESASCDASMVTQHYALGRDIGLSGTPAIVFEDGTLVGGYLPPAQLSQRLQRNAVN